METEFYVRIKRPAPPVNPEDVANKEYVDARPGGGGGGTADHRYLLNRNAPDQHNTEAVTHDGEALDGYLEALSTTVTAKADAADLDKYALVAALNAGLAGKANTVHTQAISTITGLQPALDDKIDATTFSAMMATKAPLSSGIIDTTLTKSGTSFVVDTAPFPSPLPQYVTVRAKAPAAYAVGDTLTVNSTAVPLTTPGGKALPANAWASGSGVELTIDTTGNKAFFKYGVGESSGGGGTVEWAIFPGMTPNENSAPGLYIPDADAPTLTMIDGHFVITGLGGGRVVDIAGNAYSVYFLLENKTVWSCGYNNYGQLGRNVATGGQRRSNLGKIDQLSNVIAIAAGSSTAFFLLENKTVWSCGQNTQGQLGRNVANGTEGVTNLGEITGLSGVARIVCTFIGNSAFFLLENKTVWSCGYNNYGQLGRNVATGSATATNLGQIAGLSGVIDIVSYGSSSHTFFLLENKTVWSCGYNNYGQLGRNVATGSATATNLGQITGLSNVVVIVASDSTAYFLLENKTVWSCGRNVYGNLGRNVADGSATATNLGQITGLVNVAAIAVYNFATYFLLENKTVWSCGGNNYGQLGRNVATGSATATNLGQIAGLSGVVDIAGNAYSVYFLLENKTVWSCGYNNYGQLGRNVAGGTEGVTNLGEIIGLSGVMGIAGYANPSTAFFLLENKTVWSCGQNNYGQLGREVSDGFAENTNLGRIDVLYGGTESIHSNGTLMIEIGDAGLADSAPVLVTNDATVSLPVTQVYQTKNGIDQRLEFIVKAA